MTDLNYELAPKQGMTASQRKAELDGSRFVAVRNLAYMQYKKPDGSALMTYQETLDDRERVKNTIITHEISQGLLVNDLGTNVAPATQQPQMQPQMQATPTMPVVQPNGAPMNQPPMSFQQPAQQPQQQVSPQAFAQMPMAQPQPTFAPQAQPQMQFAQPQGQPQMQAAPQAAPEATAAPTGKKRRAPSGASVAPPPPPPGAQYPAAQPPGFQQPQQATQPAPVMTFAPTAAPPSMAQPAFAAPFQPAPAQQQQLPLQAPPMQQPQAAPQQAAVLDLGPVIARIDDLGKGVMIAANNADSSLKGVAALKADLDEVKNTMLQLLTATHHMYLTNQTLANQLGPDQVKAISTLNDFRSYLQKYIGSPK